MSDSDFEMSDANPKRAPAKPLADRTNSPLAKTGKTNASSQYQRLSQLEHVLKRPDTYIGSTEKYPAEMWIFNEQTESMERKTVNIVPGLFKIFDEILVNAADNKVRDPSMKKIEVNIDPEKNLIEVKNDGRGIPVEIHDKEQMYIPEMIFGNLLTSSNYDDDEKKITGGRNGYGAKLCNIFSTEFIVETADKNTGKLYRQVWKNNMSQANKPRITEMKKPTEYTKVSFTPDLAKFHMDKLDEDILGVMRRRVYDLCGSVNDIGVFLNGKRLKIRNFKAYVEMYVKALEAEKEKEKDSNEEKESLKPPTIVHQVINDRWELAFAVSENAFHQVSFVNSIATTSGGTHVSFVTDQLVNKLMDHVKKKNKKAVIKPFQIKNNMFIFIKCLIENPSFNSQTKEQLTTRPSQFGGKRLELPDEFVRKVLRTEIVENILNIVQSNADRALKKSDGSRKSRIVGYPKLEDANKAGSREGYKCTLILTEGDSALSLAVAGLSVVGRNYYGCYPLRGKMLNVREASPDQIMKNAEIEAIKRIMGLQHKKHYNEQNINTLRYGHVMIMADQDHDGSHIKGLIINFLETSFPGLLQVPGFLIEFITPIVKVTITSGRNKGVVPFYTMPEYEAWRDGEGKNCSYKQKYFKGLGTSSPVEGREYFSKLDKHLKTFHALKESDKELIDLAFSKKKADDRKEWLREFEPGTHLDPELSEIPISDFINKELILFSMADNIRSIPSVLDGLKPAQRKILYGCYKRNLKSEIKVSQLAGYIGEHTGYHHGDASLIQSIVGLAQDFIGSNNLYLLQPNGCFGTRATGGKDASAPRYIFTELSKVTRKIFHPDDSPLLSYLQDDEQTVEPEWYVPVLPMLLVNGSEGIGTGWSTNIPGFNPVDIVRNIRHLMNGEELEDMVPWFRAWEGEVERISPGKFKMEGKIEQIDETTLEITEIPAKTWTLTMKEFLLQGLAGSDKVKPWIKDMEEQHTLGLKFVIKLSPEEMQKSLTIGLKERFKLVSTINLSNMVAFDPRGKIKKYENVNQILEDYYYVRLEYYQKRKDYVSEQLSNQLEKLSAQARFVKMIIDKQLVVSNKKRDVLVTELEQNKFPRFGKDGAPILQSVKQEHVSDEMLDVEDEVPKAYSSYDYLLGMAIWSLTRERYEKLLQQRDEKEQVLTELLKKSAKDLWNEDLDEFLAGWDSFLEEDLERRAAVIPDAPKKKTKRRKKDDDEEYGPVKKKPVKGKADSKPKADAKPKAESKQAPKKQATLSFPKENKLKKEPKFESVFGKGGTMFGKKFDELSSSFDGASAVEPPKEVASKVEPKEVVAPKKVKAAPAVTAVESPIEVDEPVVRRPQRTQRKSAKASQSYQMDISGSESDEADDYQDDDDVIELDSDEQE